MLKKTLIALATIALLLAVTSYFSPHWTIYQMRSAIEKRDYAAFSQYVDFPALRESFKQQMTAALVEKTAGKQENDPLAAIGKGIVASLVAPMLDIMITPAGVIEMMNTGIPKMTTAVVTSAITRAPSPAESIPDMELSYPGWDTVAFRRADTPEDTGSFILRRRGLWSWELAAVDV
jgi:hypothetical protein